METAVRDRGDADVIVMAAAVADFRPKAPEGDKIKKAGGPPEVVLEALPLVLHQGELLLQVNDL